MPENTSSQIWTVIGKPEEFSNIHGTCIKIDDEQIAIFKHAGKHDWFATQNMCPHDKRLVLAGGLLGNLNGSPKVTCPVHKRSFSLETGKCITDSQTPCLKTYPIKEEDGRILIQFS